MNLTPLDVLQRKFAKRWRGLDAREVKDFLEIVAGDLEEMIRENRFLEEELKKANNLLAGYRERENTLKETMITAQRVTQDMKNNVKKEAEIVLSEARMESEKIVMVAHKRAAELSDEITGLKRQRVQLESELRHVLTLHIKMLDADKDAKAEKEELEEKIKYLTPGNE